MPVKLVERERVKDLAGIARADTLYDGILNSLIERVSAEAEDYCRRKFKKSARVVLMRSYDQYPNEPDCQYLWLDGPVDRNELLAVTYSPNMRHSTEGIHLVEGDDWFFDEEHDLIRITPYQGLLIQLVAWQGLCVVASPTGFQVQYTGGYTKTEPPVPYTDPDPLDDFGVTQVPEGLKSILASKVWESLKARMPDLTGKQEFVPLKPWTKEDYAALDPWKRKDII